MNLEKRGIYISYFWKYANNEQIQDMLVLSIDMMIEYILELGKEFYEEYGFEKTNEKSIIKLSVRYA